MADPAPTTKPRIPPATGGGSPGTPHRGPGGNGGLGGSGGPAGGDPWANFPGGNPFGPNGPFGPGGPFGGSNPFGPNGPPSDMDAWFRTMGIDPADFRRMVEDMQRGLADAFRNMGQDPSKAFVSGFNVRIGPDGKPSFSTFGNKPQVKPNPNAGPVGIPTIVNEREPLTDVIDEGERLAITLEMPGVDRKDISLHMTETELEISVDTEARKYHKSLRLPAKVDPSTTKATCTNGVLDITVQKVAPTKSGMKINID